MPGKGKSRPQVKSSQPQAIFIYLVIAYTYKQYHFFTMKWKTHV